MELERLILGHCLLSFELVKKHGIKKELFKNRQHRLIFQEIENGNTDIALISQQIKIQGIASYLAGLLVGLHKTNINNVPRYIAEIRKGQLRTEALRLIEKGAKNDDYDHEKIKDIYKKLERLDSPISEKELETETLKEFIDHDFPKRQTLIDPIFGSQEMIMLHGRPKIGKSLLTMQLIRCLYTGEDWLGFKTYKLEKPTLIIQVEIAQALMQERVQKIFKDIDCPEKIIIPLKNRNIFFDQKSGREHVSRLIEKIEPSLVILDPYSKFFSDEEAAIKNPRPFFDFWQEQIELHELSLLFVHHDAKFQEGKIGGQKALGYTSINATTDSNWNIDRILDVGLDPVEFLQTARLSFESRNWQNIRPLDIRLNDNLAFETTVLPKGSVNKWDIVEEIEKAGGQIGQKELIKQYSSVRAFYQAKNKAIENDLIDEVKLENVTGKPVMLMLKDRDTGK